QLADEMLRLTETLQLARAATSAGLIHSGIAHARGDLDSAAALYATPLETMKRGSARDGVTMEVVCRTELAASRGSGLSEMGDQLQFLFDYNPPDSYVLGGLLACALVERGEFERARAAVRLLPPLVEDPLTAVWVAFAGMALAGLGDRDACAEFYPGMARYAGILPGATVGFPMLPMDLVLAQVARTMGRADLAREHLETARRIATTWQNGPWLALVEREAAELGLADGRIS
ncbi:MAG TPA: hypothetical protein VKQ07_04470, partial [Jatrophihabitantaceae bacterium]|nr:hypothetical protein [Jatrophihabitantaceae bacterium]